MLHQYFADEAKFDPKYTKRCTQHISVLAASSDQLKSSTRLRIDELHHTNAYRVQRHLFCPHGIILTSRNSFTRQLRDRTKFTGYLSPGFGKELSEKKTSSPFFSRKKSLPIIFSKIKTVRPHFLVEKSSRPPYFSRKKTLVPLSFSSKTQP